MRRLRNTGLFFTTWLQDIVTLPARLLDVAITNRSSFFKIPQFERKSNEKKISKLNPLSYNETKYNIVQER